MAAAARAQFQFALTSFIPQTGLLTDELQATARNVLQANNVFPDPNVAVDARLLPEGNYKLGTENVYNTLQQMRALANQAIEALAVYDPDHSANRRGELYALEGYTEVMLADLFCSGVPLSTSDFDGGYTLQPGSTTMQVYQHAVALFDSALALASDSAPIAGLASVGKGRALLALGQYAQAAEAVSSVPVTFQYSQSIKTCGSTLTTTCPNTPTQTTLNLASIATVSDTEGGAGLPYASSHDPRTRRRTPYVGIVNNDTVWFPAKYNYGGISTIVVASGIEVQLIQAEADLHAGNAAWLTTLNTLRTTGVYTDVDTLIDQIVPNAVDTAKRDTTFWYDTAWVAGTGGVGHLGPLTDPGTADGRLALLFHERAYWLYLTGERQGDLRRLVTQYHRTGYPSGSYPNLGAYGTGYGPNIDAPIPISELNNSLFKGCLSRDTD
jgi:hypothetical protein